MNEIAVFSGSAHPDLAREICEHLQANGWLYSANDAGYDRERALFPEDLFAWLEATQSPTYEKALKAATAAEKAAADKAHAAQVRADGAASGRSPITYTKPWPCSCGTL